MIEQQIAVVQDCIDRAEDITRHCPHAIGARYRAQALRGALATLEAVREVTAIPQHIIDSARLRRLYAAVEAPQRRQHEGDGA